MNGDCDMVCANCGRTLIPSGREGVWTHAATHSVKCQSGGTAAT